MDARKFSKIADTIIELKASWFFTVDQFTVSQEDIDVAEKRLGAKLPTEYTFFLLNYRAGYFAFLEIYSLNPKSDSYLFTKKSTMKFPENFIPFSDDGTGGFYGFLKHNGIFCNDVYYIDSVDNQIQNIKKVFLNLLFQMGSKKIILVLK